MQTGTYFHDDEEYQLSFDTFDGSLYRIIEKRPHHLHTCRVIDCFSLNVAWLDYLAMLRGEGTQFMILRSELTQRILYKEHNNEKHKSA
jgi:hypothetical protein